MAVVLWYITGHIWRPERQVVMAKLDTLQQYSWSSKVWFDLIWFLFYGPKVRIQKQIKRDYIQNKYALIYIFSLKVQKNKFERLSCKITNMLWKLSCCQTGVSQLYCSFWSVLLYISIKITLLQYTYVLGGNKNNISVFTVTWPTRSKSHRL